MTVIKTNFIWNQYFSIFSSSQFLNSQSKNHFYLSSENDELIIPVVIKKKAIFKFAVFYCGIINKNNLDISIEKEFLNSAVCFLKNEKCDFIAHPPSYVLFNVYPDNSISAPFGTYLLDLMLSEEELWNNLHQKHRNVIRNAMKNGVSIIRNKNKPYLIYEMLVNTMKRSGMGFSGQSYFENIIHSLGDNIEIFCAYKDDILQGCAVIPFSKYSAYYLWGGSIEKPVLGSLNLLQWEAIKYFKSIGVKQYNFVGARLNPVEGSKLEGIQRFKSRFGADLKTGYLWKMPLHPFKYHLFALLIKLKNLGKGSSKDIIDQEREKKSVNME